MHRNNIHIVSLLVLLLLCIFNAAPGQEVKQQRWFETISVNGFFSTAFTYNFNRPDTMKNFFHVFDTDDRSIKVDVVELSLKKDVSNAEDAGFRFDLTAGSSVPRVAHSSGMDIGDLDFHQMYMSYIAPLGKGLRLDVGKFITPLGYEVIEGYDGYNDQYGRSFMFGYAIPFTHTGIKASYMFNEQLSGMLMVVNGWDNALDNNRSKSVGIQLGVVPVSGMNFLVNVMSGPEKPGNTTDNRTVFDLTGTYSINDNITIGANMNYGMEEHSAASNGTARWFGLAGYLRLNLDNRFSLSLRGEQFEDRDGVRTSVSQILKEITLTPEYRPAEHLVVRGDIRVDRSDREVFPKKNTVVTTQSMVGINVLYIF